MKASILLIAYNHEEYITDAVDSILMQINNFETEIILLDDASTDDTFALASSKLAGTENAQLVKNDVNLGITKNYQKGFSLCTGEYVFVLEGDDYWTDIYKVQKQVDFLEQHPFHSMCFHSFMMQQESSRIFHPAIASENVAADLANPDRTSARADFYSYGINHLIAAEGFIGTFSVCCYRKKLLDRLPDKLFNVVAYDWAVNLFMAHFGLLGRLNTVMGVYRFAVNATWSKILWVAFGIAPLIVKVYSGKSSIKSRQLTIPNQGIALPQ
jgi:glycosyltransferase involved in cell wall biosynthesis